MPSTISTACSSDHERVMLSREALYDKILLPQDLIPPFLQRSSARKRMLVQQYG